MVDGAFESVDVNEDEFDLSYGQWEDSVSETIESVLGAFQLDDDSFGARDSKAVQSGESGSETENSVIGSADSANHAAQSDKSTVEAAQLDKSTVEAEQSDGGGTPSGSPRSPRRCLMSRHTCTTCRDDQPNLKDTRDSLKTSSSSEVKADDVDENVKRYNLKNFSILLNKDPCNEFFKNQEKLQFLYYFKVMKRDSLPAARTPTSVMGKTPTSVMRKTPTSVMRKTPTSVMRKTPTSVMRKTSTSVMRKTPTTGKRKAKEKTAKQKRRLSLESPKMGPRRLSPCSANCKPRGSAGRRSLTSTVPARKIVGKKNLSPRFRLPGHLLNFKGDKCEAKECPVASKQHGGSKV